MQALRPMLLFALPLPACDPPVGGGNTSVAGQNGATETLKGVHPPVSGQTAQASASASVAPVAPPKAPGTLPADVTAFKVRRDDCDHFRGEEPYDADRAAFLRVAVNRTCDGADAELAALRRRYAGDGIVLATLADYDDRIEPLEEDEYGSDQAGGRPY